MNFVLCIAWHFSLSEEQLLVPSFKAQYGYKNRYCAADMVYSCESLLEAPVRWNFGDVPKSFSLDHSFFFYMCFVFPFLWDASWSPGDLNLVNYRKSFVLIFYLFMIFFFNYDMCMHFPLVRVASRDPGEIIFEFVFGEVCGGGDMMIPTKRGVKYVKYLRWN